MKLDSSTFGYVAIGDVIYFRPLTGADVYILRVPEDIDSHTVAESLNASANAILGFIRAISMYKF